MSTTRKTRSQGPAEKIDIDHPHGEADSTDSLLDLEYQLVRYGSFHHTTGNKIIHMIFVPAICWSTLCITSQFYLPNVPLVVLAKGIAFQPSIALLLAVGYQIFYFLLDPVAGATFLPISVLEYLTATYIYAFPPASLPFQKAFHPSAMPFAWTIFTASWIFQFIGHGVFEKRKPALTESLVQALVAAPFFIWIELLHSLFNFKADLMRKVERRVAARVRAYHKKQE